jgi:hypothetical protein
MCPMIFIQTGPLDELMKPVRAIHNNNLSDLKVYCSCSFAVYEHLKLQAMPYITENT